LTDEYGLAVYDPIYGNLDPNQPPGRPPPYLTGPRILPAFLRNGEVPQLTWGGQVSAEDWLKAHGSYLPQTDVVTALVVDSAPIASALSSLVYSKEAAKHWVTAQFVQAQQAVMPGRSKPPSSLAGCLEWYTDLYWAIRDAFLINVGAYLYDPNNSSSLQVDSTGCDVIRRQYPYRSENCQTDLVSEIHSRLLQMIQQWRNSVERCFRISMDPSAFYPVNVTQVIGAIRTGDDYMVIQEDSEVSAVILKLTINPFPQPGEVGVSLEVSTSRYFLPHVLQFWLFGASPVRGPYPSESGSDYFYSLLNRYNSSTSDPSTSDPTLTDPLVDPTWVPLHGDEQNACNFA
jgi:hypothetical protein